MKNCSRHVWLCRLFAAILLATTASLHATTYEVGPGKICATPSDVPWESLQPGDLVLIYWRAAAYTDKWVICRQGTAAAPIVVRGVPGAGGALPVIDGNGAVTRPALNFWGDARSVIKIGGAYRPADTRPAYITIENLDVRGARPPNTFTNASGAMDSYQANAAAIHIEKGEHITIRNCDIHDSGNGLFVSSSDYQATSDVLIEGNHIFDNGNVGSDHEHNSYTAAAGIIFQNNRFGPLRAGCLGNNIKDRSAGLVVRYNWIEGGSRQLDLVDGEDSALIRADPRYAETFVYGNVLLELVTTGSRQIVHYGGDSGVTANYRKGKLYFYNNTVYSTRTNQTSVFSLSTPDEHCDFRNCIVYITAIGRYLYVLETSGYVDMSHNWFKTGWVSSPRITDDGTTVSGTTPGFVSVANQNFHLLPNSTCRDAGALLHTNALPDNDVLASYVKHQAAVPRIVTGALDLGAFEYAPGSAYPSPAIVIPPESQSVTVGTPAVFEVIAEGQEPLAYQWFFNASPIAGENADVFTLPATATGDVGDYSVVVTNAFGSVTSSIAALIVNIPPSITRQPGALTINPGVDATFSVDVAGTSPFTYQWRFNGAEISDATNISYTRAAVAAADAGNYSVVVSNIAGSVTSSVAPLSVNVPVAVSQPPASRTNISGTDAAFAVGVIGTPPFTYQWRFNGAEISGATNNNFTRAIALAGDAGDYSVVVSNIAGVATSSAAALTITPDSFAPTVQFVSPPANARITNTTVTVIGKATDNVRVGLVLYQWNDPSGIFQPAIGTTNWSATLNLVAGSNVIRVKSVDVSGKESLVVTRSFFSVVNSVLTIRTNGSGGVSPDIGGQPFEIGRLYTISAQPAANNLFTNWSGGVSSDSARLTFLMQLNLVLEANFVTNRFIAAAGTYSGLFREPGGVANVSSGFFSIKTTAKQTFTGKISVGGGVFPLNGSFTLDGSSSAVVLRKAKSPLTVVLHLDLSGATDEITGTVSDGIWTAELLSHRAAPNAAGLSGSYTLVFPGGDAAPVAGHGYAALNVAAGGTATFVGALADGTAIRESAPLSANGQWPLFVPLYSANVNYTNSGVVTTLRETRGLLQGWVTLTNSPLRGATGSIAWIKPAVDGDVFYPAGFTQTMELLGSGYVAPASGQRALMLTNGVVVLAGGNLPAPVTNRVVLATNNLMTVLAPVNGLQLTLTPKTGLFKGSFAHPAKPGVPTAFSGALLQNQNVGAGFFAGTNLSGAIWLSPE